GHCRFFNGGPSSFLVGSTRQARNAAVDQSVEPTESCGLAGPGLTSRSGRSWAPRGKLVSVHVVCTLGVHPRGSLYRTGLWNQQNSADPWNQQDWLCHVDSMPTDFCFGSNQDPLMWVLRF
ncbi:hypothetical protein PGTUg99_012538, partial [Puccinia graminis f. sp. tritici]